MAATNVKMLTERVELLEKQLAAITKNDDSNNTKTSKKGSSKKDSPKKDAPKKERVKSTTGYIQYSNAHRDQVKEYLASQSSERPKNTDIMKELARMWKQLDDDTKNDWTTKAKELNVQYKAESVA